MLARTVFDRMLTPPTQSPGFKRYLGEDDSLIRKSPSPRTKLLKIAAEYGGDHVPTSAERSVEFFFLVGKRSSSFQSTETSPKTKRAKRNERLEPFPASFDWDRIRNHMEERPKQGHRLSSLPFYSSEAQSDCNDDDDDDDSEEDALLARMLASNPLPMIVYATDYVAVVKETFRKIKS